MFGAQAFPNDSMDGMGPQLRTFPRLVLWYRGCTLKPKDLSTISRTCIATDGASQLLQLLPLYYWIRCICRKNLYSSSDGYCTVIVSHSSECRAIDSTTKFV